MTPKLRSLLFAFASSVAIAFATLGFAPSASATWDQCPSGWFCVWTDADYQGRFARFQTGSNNLVVPIGGYVFDNKISSARNRTNVRFCLYSGYFYGGNVRSFDPQFTGYYYDNYLDSFNDATSSIKKCAA